MTHDVSTPTAPVVAESGPQSLDLPVGRRTVSRAARDQKSAVVTALGETTCDVKADLSPRFARIRKRSSCSGRGEALSL